MSLVPWIVDLRIKHGAGSKRGAEPGDSRAGGNTGGRDFHLWLPVILLLPLVLLLEILSLIVAAVVDAVLLIAGRDAGFTALLWTAFAALGETRGTEIRIANRDRTVALTIR